MTLEEIDERYHDAALDDVGEAWHEDAPPRESTAPAGGPEATPPGEPDVSRPSGGSA